MKVFLILKKIIVIFKFQKSLREESFIIISVHI